MAMVSVDSSDPFFSITAPPLDETAEQRVLREKYEVEAQRVSDAIDEEIKKERAILKKEKDIVKVLLLGQSESGKSTTLKNFRIKYAPEAWKAERASWRSVIQLNMIRSINIILQNLQAEMANEGAPNPPTSVDDDDEDTDSSHMRERPSFVFTDYHRLLSLRLRPLQDLEKDLKRRLGASTEEESSSSYPLLATPFDISPSPARPTPLSRRPQEPCVRSLKNALDSHIRIPSSKHSHSGHENTTTDEATEVIASCRDDMRALWTNPVVRDVLDARNIHIEDSAGFFLDDLNRIATRSYEPSDDDIVRARLRTLGVQEHRLRFEQGSEVGREWAFFDVGGSRSQRSAWMPFFENVQAIIFLAPISCFDERLAEDSRVNRLEDSFILWKAICSSKLLAKTTMIIFLNKFDLLDRKIRAGKPVRQFLPSYADRENSALALMRYLRQKFKDVLKQHSPEPRVCYAYATSVTDTKATAITLGSVRDGILRGHLRQADFV